MSSLTLVAGTDGCTSSTCGDTPTSDAGARSVVVSKPSLVNRLGLTTSVLLITSTVWPSGGALATSPAPILPLPPGWVSPQNCWPMRSEGFAASLPATPSTDPPGP